MFEQVPEDIMNEYIEIEIYWSTLIGPIPDNIYNFVIGHAN